MVPKVQEALISWTLPWRPEPAAEETGDAHTSFPIVVDGAGLCRHFLPAFELQVLVPLPDLGEGLIDVHR